jgi:hypothetical protein
MEKLTLSELSLKYFELEKQINETIEKKTEVMKEIDKLYDIKHDVYELIKKKQNEQIELNRNY